MKADLTLPENRAAFICQYYGQNVWYNGRDLCPVCADDIAVIALRRIPLSLRHISSLTLTEVKFICEKIFDTDAYHDTDEPDSQFDLEGAIEWIEKIFSEPAGYFIDGYTGEQILSAIDYLREHSFLIPYRGNSCEELIEAGLALYRKEGE